MGNNTVPHLLSIGVADPTCNIWLYQMHQHQMAMMLSQSTAVGSLVPKPINHTIFEQRNRMSTEGIFINHLN
jgi:hypothetical protein